MRNKIKKFISLFAKGTIDGMSILAQGGGVYIGGALF